MAQIDYCQKCGYVPQHCRCEINRQEFRNAEANNVTPVTKTVEFSGRGRPRIYETNAERQKAYRKRRHD